MDILTTRQKNILRLAKEKGYVTVLDIQRFYSENQKQQLQRLISLGYLKEDFEHFGHFKLTGKSFEK